MKVGKLAELLDYDVVGCYDENVTSIQFAYEAEEGSIAIAYREKDIFASKSKVILTEPIMVKTDKTLLFCYDKIGIAAVKVAKVLEKHGYYTDDTKPILYRKMDENILIGDGSLIGTGTKIAPFTTIGSGVRIGRNCRIDSHVCIESDIQLGDNVIIHSGARIGVSAFYHIGEDGEENLKTFAGVGTVKIGNHVDIGCNTIIQRGTFSDTEIGDNTKIGNLIDIGHDVKIGRNCKIVSQVGIAGNVTIGDQVLIYGQVGIANDVVIGSQVTIKGKSLVSKNVNSRKTVSGIYAREHKEELKFQAKLRKIIKEKKENG